MTIKLRIAKGGGVLEGKALMDCGGGIFGLSWQGDCGNSVPRKTNKQFCKPASLQYVNN